MDNLFVQRPLAPVQSIGGGGTGATTAQGAAANLGAEFLFYSTYVAVTAPADTNNNTLGTCTLPAGAMGPNGTVRVEVFYSCTNNANVKTIQVTFGGTIYATRNIASNVSYGQNTLVHNRNSASSQFGNPTDFVGGYSLGTIAYTTSAVNTANAVTINTNAQKATGGDVITFEGMAAYVRYGA